MAHVERPMIGVTLVHAAAPHQIETETLLLPAGATVRDACTASALARRHMSGPAGGDACCLGIWGRLCGPDTVLQEGDRLELLRPLLIDPMEARRQRLRRDGLRKVRRSARPARGA